MTHSQLSGSKKTIKFRIVAIACTTQGRWEEYIKSDTPLLKPLHLRRGKALPFEFTNKEFLSKASDRNLKNKLIRLLHTQYKMMLQSFWTPCYFYNDIKSATTTIAFYTAMFSLIALTYTCYVMNGGESSQYYMPYFETDIRSSTQLLGAFAILYFLAFFFLSILLVRGIKNENRGMILPWLIWMGVFIVYQIYYGVNMLLSYYIYLESVFAVLVCWIWMGYNIYCMLCIYTQYQIIREKQQPQLIFVYP